jgi:hypothetical protein
VSGGHALESEGGRWLWLQGEVEHSLARLGGYWLDYHEEFDYAAGGIQLHRAFKFGADRWTITPLAMLGYWSADTTSETYGVGGLAAEWTRPVGSVLLRLRGDAYAVGNNGFESGAYASLGTDVFYVLRGTTIGVGGSVGFNPGGTEGGFVVWAARQLNDRLRIDAQVAHTVTDPIFGSPGALGLTLSASWRFIHRERVTAPTLATVGAFTSRGRTVKFTVQAPAHARTVAVSGTFSDWRPVALKREGQGWAGTVTIPEGTHQYGFLINGTEWFVPPNAADVIDDGFGRKNVTLVVRPK